MTIPADRLQDWIADIIGNDCAVYAMPQSGERDIKNLGLLRPMHSDWQHEIHRPRVLLHDHEPLDYRRYRAGYMREHLADWYQIHRYDQADVCDHQAVLDLLANSNLAFINQHDSRYDRMILVHSESQSPHVTLYQRLGMIPVYWWSHAMLSRDWFRYAQHDPRLRRDINPTRMFNVYNRAWAGTREYRIKFTEMILDRDLEHCTSIRFNPVDNGVHYLDHVFQNKQFQVNRDLSQLSPNTAQPSSSAEYDVTDYAQSVIDVVLETLFDDRRLHLTEKTLRPIACGKPFLLVGTAGSLAYLHRYGFRTFGAVWDESYDLESDPVRRLERICTVMQDLSCRSGSEIRQACADICEYNRAWFFSEEFQHRVMSEFLTNFDLARKECENHKSAKNWRRFRSVLYRHDPTHVLLRLYDRAGVIRLLQAAVSLS